jgi:hypothetical protein
VAVAVAGPAVVVVVLVVTEPTGTMKHPVQTAQLTLLQF